VITLKCTRNLLELVGGVTIESPPASTSVLGDWYANIVPTAAGELVAFANEKTLLSVALSVEMLDSLVPSFVARVYNLLRIIKVPEKVALQECTEMEDVEFSKTSSRSIVGSLGQISFHYQLIAERDVDHKPLSISHEELILSRMLHKPLDYEYPADIAKKLLSERYGDW